MSNLYVLVNGTSFSVTTEFSARIHADQRGTFIGQETGGGYGLNSSSIFAITQLPNSKIDLGIGMFGFHMANTSTVTTYAGRYSADATCKQTDGKNSEAEFCSLWDLTIDGAGNLYVPDWGNHTVRKVTDSGTSTFIRLGVGYIPNGPRAKGGVYQPWRIHYDINSNQMLVVTGTGSSLKLLGADDYFYNATGNVVKADYADNSPGSKHSFESVVMNKKGEIIWVDKYNHCIRKSTLEWK